MHGKHRIRIATLAALGAMLALPGVAFAEGEGGVGSDIWQEARINQMIEEASRANTAAATAAAQARQRDVALAGQMDAMAGADPMDRVQLPAPVRRGSRGR
jgi:hypothetical protein